MGSDRQSPKKVPSKKRKSMEPEMIADTSTSPQKKQRSDDVPKTVEFSNYEVSSPEASDTNTINNGSNMNPEPAEVLNLSPVIERNASIELSPGISEKEPSPIKP